MNASRLAARLGRVWLSSKGDPMFEEPAELGTCVRVTAIVYEATRPDGELCRFLHEAQALAWLEAGPQPAPPADLYATQRIAR